MRYSTQVPPRGSRIPAALAALSALAGGAGAAQANGRLPSVATVFPGPETPTVLDLGATFGLVSTLDDGASWRWVCEMSIGYIGTLDPTFLRVTNGTLLASTFQGLTRSLDGGCTFDPVPDVGDLFVRGLVENQAVPGTVYVVTGGGGAPTGTPAFYVSTDGGMTFAPTTLTSTDVYYDGIGLTAADPMRVYVGGWRDLATGLFVYRSDDGGATWTEFPKTGPDSSRLRVVGVSDVDPDVLFWLHDAPTDTIYRSDDGGLTETAVLNTPGTVTAFAVGTGGVAYAATSYGDLQRSDDGGLSFAPVVGTPPPYCIATSGSRVYICANPFVGNFAVGYSDDLGADWTGLLYLADIDGPVVCPAGTPTHDLCEPAWPALEKFLNALDGVDGGAPGTDAGTGTGADAGVDAGTGKDGHGGCHCAVAGAGRARGAAGARGAGAVALAALAAAAALRWRRRHGHPEGRAVEATCGETR